MTDELDRLVANVMRDTAKTIDKMRDLAAAAGWTAEEALTKAAEMIRAIASKFEASP